MWPQDTSLQDYVPQNNGYIAREIISVATPSCLVRLAACFYRTYVIAFSSVMIQVTSEREGAARRNFFFPFPFHSRSRRFSSRHSTTTHAASGSRHVTRVRRTKAHNARVARTIRNGCTGMWRPPPSRHLVYQQAAALSLFASMIAHRDAADRHSNP